jgi:hypothetical protein
MNRLPGDIILDNLTPSVLIRRGSSGGAEQAATLRLRTAAPSGPVSVIVTAAGGSVLTEIDGVPEGESDVTVFLSEISTPETVTVHLRRNGKTIAELATPWLPPRHWKVHLVNLSHHDAGYTNLPSLAIAGQHQSLLRYLELARAADAYPDAAQQRIVVEQCWSIDYFMSHGTEAEVAEMLARIRSGHVELTALFGNMATELCGHESLIRTLYHGARLARRSGVPIVSAQHCDNPGIVWGLSEILAGAGIEFLDCAFTYFDSWERGADRPDFWDQQAVFGTRDIPGAFWWETPSGRRLLVWSNNVGCNGERDLALPTLPDTLRASEEQGYPGDIMRWPVTGANRDNSPYIDFATTVKTWNETWLWPRLICSTNAAFYADLKPQIPADLPVLRGDIPGQDFPVAAACTAAATAVNRDNHRAVPQAETLATLAAAVTSYNYQDDVLFQAYEEVNWHDEHTWGHHMPCGPAAAASELEKAVHAHRAAALAYDVHAKAMARIADTVRLDGDDVHLVVFNPSPFIRTDLVVASMREIENCISELKPKPPAQAGKGELWPVVLGTRWHVNPPLDLVEGIFELVDLESGSLVDFQITELDSPLSATPYAPQRIGLSQGGRRLAIFEEPLGMRRDLRFIADNVPPLGYRTYRLQPIAASAETPPVTRKSTESIIENAFYRVHVSDKGAIASIYDKVLDRELVDQQAPHDFGRLLVSDIQGEIAAAQCTAPPSLVDGPLQSSLRWSMTAPGHPAVKLCITLTAGIKRVEFNIGLLKDPTPNLECLVPFPLALPDGRYTIEEPLHVTNPETDRLPGTFSNRLTSQDWLKVTDNDISVLWCGLDSGVVSIGRLWRSRMSPAHSVLTPPSSKRPQIAEELRGGGLYSSICYNNLGTNFAVSQEGKLFFRYVISSVAGDASIADMRRFAAAANSPFTGIFTQHPYERTQPTTAGFMAIDNPAVALLTCKQAEDGNGMILRLWNPTNDQQDTVVALPHFDIRDVIACDLIEKNSDSRVSHDGHSLRTVMAPQSLITLRVLTG